MKVGFFGTPDLAAQYLSALATRHQVCGVVTQPDKPRGRHGTPSAPPVKELAQELGMEIHQPVKGECPAACQCIEGSGADVCVVVAFGQKLPCGAGACNHDTCINVHYSLLPQLRGAAPVQHAILQGLVRTGITIQHVGPGWDEGDIVLQREVAVLPDETSGELFARLTEIGPGVLLEALDLIAAGQDPRIPQDASLATFAPVIRKEDGYADFSVPAEVFARRVRAYNPWPAVTALVHDKPLKILRARAETSRGTPEGENGSIVELNSAALAVQCAQGVLWIEEVQAAGRKPMSVAEFLRGARLAIGDRLSRPSHGAS